MPGWCYGEKMIEQKLDYIHHNPVSGKWCLVNDFCDYPHPSASFYESDKNDTKAAIVHCKDIQVEKMSSHEASESSGE
jgi:hypothetical protein